MLTQHQVRKYAKVGDFEMLDLIDQMIKSLQKSKKELRDQLVAEGRAEYKVTHVEEYTVKAHERKTFRKV